jgi:hypothetical protein
VQYNFDEAKKMGECARMATIKSLRDQGRDDFLRVLQHQEEAEGEALTSLRVNGVLAACLVWLTEAYGPKAAWETFQVFADEAGAGATDLYIARHRRGDAPT